MNQGPLFHPNTAEQLLRLKPNLPQSLLLSGLSGIGLTTTAQWLAEKDVIEHIEPRDAKGIITTSGTISVEVIRQLYQQTRSRGLARQIVIISHADRMSAAAHGAFLKLLEEPNSSVYFILTSHTPHRLPATIRSRVQKVIIHPLTSEQTTALLEAHNIADPTKKRQLEFIAAGLPAEISRLVKDDTYFTEKAKLISDARDFLKANHYEQLLIVHAYRQDRTKALHLCDAILALLQRGIAVKPQPSFITQLERLLQVREQITANGNVLLQLTRFVV